MEGKRIRSPNYPALSLPDAIEKVTALYRVQHTHSAPREVVVRGMGYNSLNGASATAISALHKYGLLERAGDEVKISDRALRILHPESLEERATAILEAAREPPLFSELAERFPGRVPNDDLLRNYLIRRGFAPSAVTAVTVAYRETSEMAEREASRHDSGHEPTESVVMPQRFDNPTQFFPPTITQTPPPGERLLGRYDYEDGSYIKIAAAGGVDTEEALEMVETLIKMKRQELRQRKGAASRDSASAPDTQEDAEP
jgi:hypothetical protein